jgi:hypothetical protein
LSEHREVAGTGDPNPKRRAIRKRSTLRLSEHRDVAGTGDPQPEETGDPKRRQISSIDNVSIIENLKGKENNYKVKFTVYIHA